MTLSQQYRSQLLKQQQARLRGCFVVALAGHGIAIIFGTNLWQLALHPTPDPDQVAIPIEFVEVDELNSSLPPTDSSHYAQVDATAGGIHQPHLPEYAKTGSSRAEPSELESLKDSRAIPPSILSRSEFAFSPAAAATPSPTPSPTHVASTELWRTIATQVWNGVTEVPQSLRQEWEGILNSNRTAEGTIGIDAVRDEMWGEYDAQLRREVNQHWQRIDVDVDRQVKVRFTIDRQGRLQQLQILKSSGSAEADEAALAAVRLAAPFQPLPIKATQQLLQINFTFDYIAR